MQTLGAIKYQRTKKISSELIDIIEPNEVYSVGEFLKDLSAYDKSVQSNKVPILVGGSMMYFFISVDLMIF